MVVPLFSLFLLTLFIPLLFTLHDFVDSFEHIPENDLAKVCRPVDRPLDLLFLLDGSGSVGGTTFQTQMQLLNRLVDALDIGAQSNHSQLAVMQYATYSFVEFPFNAYPNKNQLRQALQRIRHKSGTTKTGKALEKAYQLFRDRATGSRPGNVAKVVVVVSDGRSIDDPVSTAMRLRQSGVSVIALGMGAHVNMAELVQMSGDTEMVVLYENQTTSAQATERFTTVFRRLSTSELCEYVLGGNGANVHCGSDAIKVRTRTTRPFRGRFYVHDRWADSECGLEGNGAAVAGDNGTELTLRIPLMKCGLAHQFSVNPKGHFFRGSALLQFHPHFRTGNDKLFPLLCFYRDRSNEPGGPGGGAGTESEIDWQLVREHTQRRERLFWGQLPCTYRLLDAAQMEQMARPGNAGGNGGGKSMANECTPTELSLGQSVVHAWECEPDQFDVYQSILVHSCMLMGTTTTNGANGGGGTGAETAEQEAKMLIDKNGCSVEPNLLESPQYVHQLKAFARGVAIRGTGNGRMLQMRCSLRFCDRLMDECEEMLPPKCATVVSKNSNKEFSIDGEEAQQQVQQDIETTANADDNNNNNNGDLNGRKRRRQSGFPVLIRPLNGYDDNVQQAPPPLQPAPSSAAAVAAPTPPLLMFTRSSSRRAQPTPVLSPIIVGQSQAEQKLRRIIKINSIEKEEEKVSADVGADVGTENESRSIGTAVEEKETATTNVKPISVNNKNLERNDEKKEWENEMKKAIEIAKRVPDEGKRRTTTTMRMAKVIEAEQMEEETMEAAVKVGGIQEGSGAHGVVIVGSDRTAADPFQEENEVKNNGGRNGTTNEAEANLDPELFARLSETEIVVCSQELQVLDVVEQRQMIELGNHCRS